MADPTDTASEAGLAAVLALGALEGLTEFLPVSSTGHLILAVDHFRLTLPPERVFEVAIQSGAIMAVCVVYFTRLRDVVLGLQRDSPARAFVRNVVLTSLPAAILGFLFHEAILTALFDPRVVAVALILGGLAMLATERIQTPVRFTDVSDISPSAAIAVGVAQCLALIPGISRSAATIIGALLVGVERRTAAAYSFFVALPVLLGATGLQLTRTADSLRADDVVVLTAGGVAAFVFAVLSIRVMIAVVARIGFAPFAIYRIALGSLALLVVW